MRLAETHPEWLLGFEDEVWWSRVSQPHLHSWAAAGRPLHLVEPPTPRAPPGKAAEPLALACYGLLARWHPTDANAQEAIWLRFVDGRPVSTSTIAFLAWCCDQAAALGKAAILLVWDNASWHLSHAVTDWLRDHNQQVKSTGQGVRLLPCRLPSKSPWLNPIEPKWVHGKRAVVEPARTLTADQLEQRICAYYACDRHPRLSITEQVA
jgi:hypothetical protein